MKIVKNSAREDFARAFKEIKKHPASYFFFLADYIREILDLSNDDEFHYSTNTFKQLSGFKLIIDGSVITFGLNSCKEWSEMNFRRNLSETLLSQKSSMELVEKSKGYRNSRIEDNRKFVHSIFDDMNMFLNEMYQVKVIDLDKYVKIEFLGVEYPSWINLTKDQPSIKRNVSELKEFVKRSLF